VVDGDGMPPCLKTVKRANRLVFCQYMVCSLLFLTIFGPKPYYFVFSNVGRSVAVDLMKLVCFKSRFKSVNTISSSGFSEQLVPNS